MSENKKDRVQVKITLEGPMKDFLEKEADLQCRKITAHVRYILNNYYAERIRTAGSRMVDTMNFMEQQSNYYEPMVRTTNYHEPIVHNTNYNEPKSTLVNNAEPESNKVVHQSDEESPQKDVLEKEDFGYIDQDALDF